MRRKKRKKPERKVNEKNLYTLQKRLRALNSNECIILTAQKCEDVFTGMEF